MDQPELDFDQAPEPAPEQSAARQRRGSRPRPVAVPQPPPVHPGLSFEDQEHLRTGAGTFEVPYIFRSPDEYWMVVASDARTGRHAAARFMTDAGDDTAHGHRQRVQELKDMMGVSGYTGRERAVALAKSWQRIHREVNGPARPARRRTPRRQWPYEPAENAVGATVTFEVDGEQLTGQIWGTSPRARARYALTDDQRLFHVDIDTLTGRRVNPDTNLNIPYREKIPAHAAPTADYSEYNPDWAAKFEVDDLLRAGDFEGAKDRARRAQADPAAAGRSMQLFLEEMEAAGSRDVLVEQRIAEAERTYNKYPPPRVRPTSAAAGILREVSSWLPADHPRRAEVRRREAQMRSAHFVFAELLEPLQEVSEARPEEAAELRTRVLRDLQDLRESGNPIVGGQVPEDVFAAVIDRADALDPHGAAERAPLRPHAPGEEPERAATDPFAGELRPGSNYEAARRVEDLLRQDEFDLARAYARREANDPILGPDMDKIQRLHRRLDPVESLQALVDREAAEVYTLARRGGARTDDQVRARRRQAHEEHVSWLLDVLPPGSVHHARARRLEAELRAEEHTHINDQIRTLAQTAEAERGPIRAELLDDLYALSRTAPAEDVAALLARANLNDPVEAGVRESLRAQLTLPAVDDPAFADVMVIDHETRTWHLSPTTPDSVRDVLAEHGFSGTYSRTDPWVVLTEDLGFEALRKRMGSLYTALDQLPEAPPRASATLWRARVSATLDEHESVRRARMGQAQDRARARIGQLMGEGEMRAAFAVVHEHIAELRAHAFLPGVIERNPEFEDLYLEVFTEADRRRELLDVDLATLPDDEATLERMAAEYRRQCPHLDEQTILETVGLAPPGISLTGSLNADLVAHQEEPAPERAESTEPPRTLTREELTELRPYLRRAMTGDSIARTDHGHRVSLERVSNRTKKELREREWMRTGPDEHLYLTAKGERVREALQEIDRPAASLAPPRAPETSTVPSQRGDAAVADEPTLFPDLNASAEPAQNPAPAPAAADENPAQPDTAPTPEPEPEAPQAATAGEPAPAPEPPAPEGPEPEEEALAEQERLAEWESIANAQVVDEAPAAGAPAPPEPAPDLAAHQPSKSAAADADLDIERERLAANLGNAPGRRATIGLTDDDTGPDPDRLATAANGRRATIFVPGDADTGPAPDPVRARETERDEPVVAERIDGRQLRAAHSDWADLYRRRGWKAATDRVDPDVYDKMRRDFEKLLKRGTDVQLVMPTNDPERVVEFAAMAREYGYEITLAARITPDAQRKLGQLEALDQHLHAGTIHQAVPLDHHQREAQNLEKILAQVHEQKLVNRVALYPREGSQPAWGTHLIHDPAAETPDRERVWSSSESVLAGLHRLQGAELSDGEKSLLRESVEQITRRLPEADRVTGEYALARTHLADGLNDLRSELRMPPADEDRARRVTVETNEREARAESAPAPSRVRGPRTGVEGESAPAPSRVRGPRAGVSGAAIDGPVPEGSPRSDGHSQAPPAHTEQQHRTMARTP
ncbi:zeta toxin family protein [Nocardiopsis sp. NPDC055824]